MTTSVGDAAIDRFLRPVCLQDAPAWEMADPLQPDRNTPFGYLDYLTWDGAPDVVLAAPRDEGSMWRSAWVNGVSLSNLQVVNAILYVA